ncbi:MAG TPA: glycosyltransferase family 2 protein [Nitrospirota bacterium]|nr:glycosyltransferase family 2 protein [Nitrospirota bacterium]
MTMRKKISIITASFNSGSTIKDCLDSVEDQGNQAEHIIIDGASTDDTLSIVRSYPHIAEVISEPDHGIYDAMNKGIALATGDVIGILNSDDYYAHPQVLERVMKVFENREIDSCYGDLLYFDPVDKTRIVRNWISGSYHERRFYWGWMPPHPTFFVRRSMYEKYGGFKLSLGSAADYELMLRFLVKHKISTAYLPEILVRMRSGGISNMSLRNRLTANRMDRYAWEANELKPYFWTTFVKPLSKIMQFF